MNSSSLLLPLSSSTPVPLRPQIRLPNETVLQIIIEFELSLKPRNWDIEAFNAGVKELHVVPLTRVCRQWRPIVESRLYHTIVLNITDCHAAKGSDGGSLRFMSMLKLPPRRDVAAQAQILLDALKKKRWPAWLCARVGSAC